VSNRLATLARADQVVAVDHGHVRHAPDRLRGAGLQSLPELTGLPWFLAPRTSRTDLRVS
jgi:hypothetical protein